MNSIYQKLECTATFIKYIASVVLLIFPPETLIWNKMMNH